MENTMQNYAKPKKSKFGKYLFCYFTGNEPERERICFALSDDGYNFTPINGGNPVIIQKKGTKCMRDPFILRNENGGTGIKSSSKSGSLNEQPVSFVFKDERTKDITFAPRL